MKIFLNILVYFTSCLTFAQVIEHELNEVTVSDSLRKFPERILTLKRTTILELQTEDAGQLLQKLAGVNIKSYGGLGGMKTISVRGLGSQHTSIVVDGFSLNNTQTGQINLGQVQSENIESMYLITGSQKSVLVPTSAQVSGSVVYIETFENSFSTEKQKVRFTTKVGSFGQLDNYLAYKLNLNRVYLSVFGKYRFANGTYPYSFQNGQTLYEGTRNNNRYTDGSGGISFGWRISENGILIMNFRSDLSDQELPGAVILYSESAVQTLKTDNNRIQAAYTHHFKIASFRAFASASNGRIEYADPTFLNSTGGIFSTYKNDQYQIGINGRFQIGEALSLFGGTEQQISRLTTNKSGFGVPFRNHNFSLLGLKYKRDFFQLTTQLSTQFVQEINDTVKRENISRTNPFIQLETKELIKACKFTISAYYRNSFRMPSFNELYYNNIGNSTLKPEAANQLAIGTFLSSKKGKFNLMNRTNAYFNQITNKIVAIPTKNLFIWSMQNIGKVNILGAETTLDLVFKMNEKWSLNSTLNYTLQFATDITDRESPTFNHQIAYIPKHAFNADISVKRKNSGLRWSTFGNSLRYSLNENISSNEVSGFSISDVAIFTSYKWKKHDFRLQISCKNILNSSYSIVRYYVMPGRNYLITLNYALN